MATASWRGDEAQRRGFPACAALSLLVAALFFPGLALAKGGPRVLLGKRGVAGVRDVARAGAVQAFKYRGKRSGVATSIFVYVGRGSHATALTAGVYANGHGRPGRLMAAGTRGTMGSGKWTQVKLRSVRAIVRGRAYWIAVRGAGGTLRLRVRGSRSRSCIKGPARTVSHLPRRWSGRRPSSHCALAAYATGMLKPVNTARPAVVGSAVQSQTLAATTGSWSNKPSSYRYQWQDCYVSSAVCIDAPGATTNTYRLSSDDVGLHMRVLVRVANIVGNASAASPLTPAVSATATGLFNTALPAVSGQTAANDTLTTTNGGWSRTPSAYSYQWEDCDASGDACVGVPGATGTAYTLTDADIGHTMRSVVTASDATGVVSATSAATHVVAAAPAHIETWASDDCGNTAGTALVRQWLTYAQSNCGPAGEIKALTDCHASGVVYCKVIQYVDPTVLYYVGSAASEQWPTWQSAAQEDWYLHEAPPNQANRITTTSYGGGYYANIANPAVVSFYAHYIRLNYPAAGLAMLA